MLFVLGQWFQMWIEPPVIPQEPPPTEPSMSEGPLGVWLGRGEGTGHFGEIPMNPIEVTDGIGSPDGRHRGIVGRSGPAGERYPGARRGRDGLWCSSGGAAGREARAGWAA